MTVSEHTPGPWTAECMDADTDCWQVPEPLVSCGSDGDYLNEANARLIAAAPDLLEVVEYVAKWGPTPFARKARLVLERVVS